MLAFDGMGALAVQEGRSWMNGRLGQRIMADSVHIIDDGPSTSGIPWPFDFEGVPKKVVPIISAGVAVTPVYDSFTAGREAGKQSTGHATPPSPQGRFGPAPMNLFLRPGTTSARGDDPLDEAGPVHHSVLVYANRASARCRRDRNDARWYICDTGRRDCAPGEIAAVHAIIRRSIEVHRSDRHNAETAPLRVRRRDERARREAGTVSLYEFDTMNTVFAILATILTFSANQGSAVQLTFPDEPGVKSVEVVWDMKKVPLSHIDDTLENYSRCGPRHETR